MFPWKEKYEFGIQTIDSQHRQLVSIINDLNISMREKSTKRELISIFQRLLKYIDIHFNYEESLFKRYKFEGAESHILEHGKFRQKITDTISNYSSRVSNPKLEKDLIIFLVEWMISHMQDTDREYIECFNEKKVVK